MIERTDPALARLPLPLAQLLQRAHNSKSLRERHNCAFYLGEAAIKLSAAGHVSAWVASREQLDSDAIAALEGIVRPSLGHWLRLTRLARGALAKQGRRGPFVGADASPPIGQLPNVQALLEALLAERILPPETISSCRRQGLPGFFDLLVQYRNRVLAHGGERPPDFYARLGPLLLAAVVEVVSCDVAFDGTRLELLAGDDSDRVHDLTGLGISAPRGLAGDLSLRRGEHRLNLHPLVIFRWHEELQRPQVGFLDRVVRRVRGSAGEREVRRTEYLEYTSGTEMRGIETARELTGFFSTLRHQRVSEGEVVALTQGSDEASEGPVSVADEGDIVGDFVVEEELSRGGMGVVYLARQLGLRRQVALKVLHPTLAPDETMVSRFRTEIMALGIADHRNIVRVLTSGGDGGRLYYAMELVDGANLSQVMEVVNGWRAGHGGLSSSGRRLGS